MLFTNGDEAHKQQQTWTSSDAQCCSEKVHPCVGQQWDIKACSNVQTSLWQMGGQLLRTASNPLHKIRMHNRSLHQTHDSRQCSWSISCPDAKGYKCTAQLSKYESKTSTKNTLNIAQTFRLLYGRRKVCIFLNFFFLVGISLLSFGHDYSLPEKTLFSETTNKTCNETHATFHVPHDAVISCRLSHTRKQLVLKTLWKLQNQSTHLLPHQKLLKFYW